MSIPQEKALRLDRLLSNLGYGSRKEIAELIVAGYVRVKGEPARDVSQKVKHSEVSVDDEPLDPAVGMVLMMHKPEGYICSRSDSGALVYELLPQRWLLRKPALSTIGRLDADTSGLLLFTDDGAFNHRLSTPKHKIAKVYEVELEKALRGDEAEIFARGDLMLEEEDKPLLPAEFEKTSESKGRLTLYEGRYHQVKRMFAALGNTVVKLHRSQIGGLTLGSLQAGEYRLLGDDEIAQLLK